MTASGNSAELLQQQCWNNLYLDICCKIGHPISMYIVFMHHLYWCCSCQFWKGTSWLQCYNNKNLGRGNEQLSVVALMGAYRSQSQLRRALHHCILPWISALKKCFPCPAHHCHIIGVGHISAVAWCLANQITGLLLLSHPIFETSVYTWLKKTVAYAQSSS